MIKVTLQSAGNFVLDEVETPVLNTGEVLIRVKSNGICAGDVAPYMGKKLDSFPLPSVIGHEFGGIVEDINGGTGDLKIGDKVAVFPALPCGTCYYCTHGLEFACENQKFLGVGGTEGGFAEMFKVPIKNCVVLDKDFDTKNIGLIEPTTVAVRACENISDSYVAILGAGSIGMLMIPVLKSRNNKIIALDIDDKHLELASKMGADATINYRNPEKEKEINSFLGTNNRIDVTILSVCNREIVDWALEVTRKGGAVRNITVMDDGNLMVDFKKMRRKSLTISGFDCYTIDHFIRAKDLIEKGIVKADDFVTKYFPLEDVKEAFDYKIRENALKVILTS